MTLSHGLRVKAEAVLDYGEKLLLSELDSSLAGLDLAIYPETQPSVFLRTIDLRNNSPLLGVAAVVGSSLRSQEVAS